MLGKNVNSRCLAPFSVGSQGLATLKNKKESCLPSIFLGYEHLTYNLGYNPHTDTMSVELPLSGLFTKVAEHLCTWADIQATPKTLSIAPTVNMEPVGSWKTSILQKKALAGSMFLPRKRNPVHFSVVQRPQSVGWKRGPYGRLGAILSNCWMFGVQNNLRVGYSYC